MSLARTTSPAAPVRARPLRPPPLPSRLAVPGDERIRRQPQGTPKPGQHLPSALDRPSEIITTVRPTAPAIAAISSQRNVSARWCGKKSESSITAGTTRSATCALDEIAISLASFIFPACAITTAPPCSAALPTIATITAAMKNSLAPTAFAKSSSECTRISLTIAVNAVATPSATSERMSVHDPSAGSPCSVSRWRRRLRHVTMR